MSSRTENSSEDLIWAYNYNAYVTEAVLAMQLSRKARIDGNPYPYGTWQWLTWERGLKEILEL